MFMMMMMAIVDVFQFTLYSSAYLSPSVFED